MCKPTFFAFLMWLRKYGIIYRLLFPTFRWIYNFLLVLICWWNDWWVFWICFLCVCVCVAKKNNYLQIYPTQFYYRECLPIAPHGTAWVLYVFRLPFTFLVVAAYYVLICLSFRFRLNQKIVSIRDFFICWPLKQPSSIQFRHFRWKTNNTNVPLQIRIAFYTFFNNCRTIP